MRSIILAATVSVVALTASAQAGDFYVGLSAGHDFATVDGVATNAGGTVPGAYDYDAAGGSIGVLAGFNFYQDNLVLGLEGDINWSDIDTQAKYVNTIATNYTHETDVNWTAAVRARFGITHGNNIAYVAVGYALADTDQNIRFVGAPAPFHSYSETRSGWTLGGGVDHAFDETFSGRLEYRYSNYGDVTDNTGVNSIDKNELTSHALRAALIMKLN
jgi:outer membrane immunogenic protein